MDISILLLVIGIFQLNIITPTYSQELSLEEIRVNLLNNPPNDGDPVIREQTILDLDDVLKNDSSRTSSEVINFYNMRKGTRRQPSIEILKMRGVKHQKRIVPFNFTQTGIEVYPLEEVFHGEN